MDIFTGFKREMLSFLHPVFLFSINTIWASLQLKMQSLSSGKGSAGSISVFLEEMDLLLGNEKN